MLARVIHLTGAAENVATGVANYSNRVAPAMRKLDGYSGARLLVNRDTGAIMSISFWRDEQTLRASETSLADVRRDAVSLFGAEAPPSENYEIAVQQRPRPTEAGHSVRLTTLQGDPAKLNDGIRHFESTVVPAVSQLAGFRGAVLFVDRSTARSLIATVWDSKAALQASADQVTSVRSQAADEMGATGPQVESYEVAFAELPALVGS